MVIPGIIGATSLGSNIGTYLKIGAVILCISVLGFFAWDYKDKNNQIADLKAEVQVSEKLNKEIQSALVASQDNKILLEESITRQNETIASIQEANDKLEKKYSVILDKYKDLTDGTVSPKLAAILQDIDRGAK